MAVSLLSNNVYLFNCIYNCIFGLYSYTGLNKHSVLHHTNVETNSTLQAELLELVTMNYIYTGPLAP